MSAGKKSYAINFSSELNSEFVMAILDGFFVLRRIEENDPRFHRVYMMRRTKSQISSADNVFNHAPEFVSKAMYNAIPIDPPKIWSVKLARLDEQVLMGIFQLVRAIW